MPNDILKRGDRIGVYRKSRRVHTGTVLRVIDANDDMTWGHKMGPDWIITIDVDGIGPRQWRGFSEMFRAKDLRKLGAVSLRLEAVNAE